MFLVAIITDKRQKWNTSVKVDGKEIVFRIDKGALVDVILGFMYRQMLSDTALFPPGKPLYGADRNALKASDYIVATLCRKDKSVQTKCRYT